MCKNEMSDSGVVADPTHNKSRLEAKSPSAFQGLGQLLLLSLPSHSFSQKVFSEPLLDARLSTRFWTNCSLLNHSTLIYYQLRARPCSDHW